MQSCGSAQSCVGSGFDYIYVDLVLTIRCKIRYCGYLTVSKKLELFFSSLPYTGTYVTYLPHLLYDFT